MASPLQGSLSTQDNPLYLDSEESTMSDGYSIPDTLENWKWPRRLNPHYLEVKAASAAWVRHFDGLGNKAQYAYDQIDIALIASLVYPLLSKERLRTGCDLLWSFVAFDDCADIAHKDDVQVMADITMEALHNPHTPRPKDEWVGGEFIRHLGFGNAQLRQPVQEAKDRTDKHIRTIDEYLELRRGTIGAKECFVILETGLNLPDEAVCHPVIDKLSTLAAELILLDNDMISYNIEQARGDNHNIVTVVMHNKKTDIQGAMGWVYQYHKKVRAEFMDIYENKIPKFGEPADTELAQYMDGLGNWVRANVEGSYESGRYFGKKGKEVQKTRWVTLLPKKPLKEIGPDGTG